MAEYKLAKRARLADNIVILDGITRSGKLFLGNMIEGIGGVDRFQYFGLLEHMGYMSRLGFIDREVAKAIIECQIDNFVYNRAVGRNMNLRETDKSSLTKSPKLQEYLARGKAPDGDPAVEKVQSGNMLFPFVIHEGLPNIKMYYEIYPTLKVIEISRNPIDLSVRWFQKGWGKRWGVDPKDFSMPIMGKNGPVPWFTYQWKDEYENLDEMDRIIRIMKSLDEMGKEGYEKLSKEERERMHMLTYEDLTIDPMPELQKIADFLGRKIIKPDMEKLLSTEKFVPEHENPEDVRDEKLAIVKKEASPECLEIIMKLHEAYQKRWRA